MPERNGKGGSVSPVIPVKGHVDEAGSVSFTVDSKTMRRFRNYVIALVLGGTTVGAGGSGLVKWGMDRFGIAERAQVTAVESAVAEVTTELAEVKRSVSDQGSKIDRMGGTVEAIAKVFGVEGTAIDGAEDGEKGGAAPGGVP